MEYMTIQDMMTTYGISRTTAYRLANSDGFPAIRVGKSIRVKKADLDNWFKTGH